MDYQWILTWASYVGFNILPSKRLKIKNLNVRLTVPRNISWRNFTPEFTSEIYALATIADNDEKTVELPPVLYLLRGVKGAYMCTHTLRVDFLP